jgi:phosphoribosylglycinamide formyltransferase 1
MAPPLRLGVLASGRGSNLAALLAAHARGDLTPGVALVVSNNSGAGALQTAREHGISALHLSTRTHADPGAGLLAAFIEHGVDVVVLAGYMRRLDARVVAAYEGRTLNIHPAPLPIFGGPGMYGTAVHAAVLAAGVAFSGPTVHRVTDGYDEGEIVAHRPVPVQPGDTPESLASRVLAAEHDLYWRVIEQLFGRAAAAID